MEFVAKFLEAAHEDENAGMKGVVAKFNAERGFGFIRIACWQEEAFVHISEVKDRKPLRPGERVRFDLERTKKGPRAVNVRPAPEKAKPSPVAGYLALAAAGAAAAAGWLGWRFGVHGAAAWLLAVNAIALLYWGWDKTAAARGAFRVPEAVLLLIALGGGTPAALLGGWLFRHKTLKTSFQLALGAILALQFALGLLLYSIG